MKIKTRLISGISPRFSNHLIITRPGITAITLNELAGHQIQVHLFNTIFRIQEAVAQLLSFLRGTDPDCFF
jgi:hypothetical protein